jgi:ATP-dependent DNA helicase RecG
MAILVAKITESECDELLNQQENHFLDFKSVDTQPASLTKHLSAFANADGGELYVGIDQVTKGKRKIFKWRGFPDQESANAHIQVIEEFFPLGDYASCAFISCKGSHGILLKIEVKKTPAVKKASDGTVYLRRGAQSLPQDAPKKIRQLELNKGIASYETETVSSEADIVINSPTLANFLSSVIPSADAITWLKKEHLIVGDKPTVAAVLLFAEVPQAILPKHCGIKILRYQTQDKEGRRAVLSFDPITIEGHLYKCIYDSVSKTVEIIENIPKLGMFGLERIDYPPETLHEIITNAVLHRDYSIATDIQIRIFDNRVEVESPGKLPGHITVDNILQERYSRNGSIVRLINKFPNPPNKDVGEGLNTAFNAMTQLKLKAPIIVEDANKVTVYIKHEPLASPAEAVLQYLDTNYTITNSRARKLTGITSENSMKKVFYSLRDKNLIERVPGKQGVSSAWQKVGFTKKLL